MSWFEENKFTAILAGATVVVSGAFLVLGKSAGGAYDKSLKDIDKTRNTIKLVKSNDPYPNGPNAAAYADSVSTYITDATAYRDSFLKFAPEHKGTPSSADVSSAITNDVKKLTEQYKQATIDIPISTQGGKFRFGFEAFGDKMVPGAITSDVEYQRQAMAWMFDQLAKAEPSAITNVHRHPVTAPVDPTAKGVSNTDRNKAKAMKKEVYRSLPIELTFKGTEESLKKFLESLAHSEEYLFSVRALRVQNEKTDAPLANAVFEEATEEEAPGADPSDFDFGADAGGGEPPVDPNAGGAVDPNGGAVDPAAGGVVDPNNGEGPVPPPEDEPTAEVQDSGILIKRISGDEELNVFLKLDLLVFKDPKKEKTIALPKNNLTKAKPKSPAKPETSTKPTPKENK